MNHQLVVDMLNLPFGKGLPYFNNKKKIPLVRRITHTLYFEIIFQASIGENVLHCTLTCPRTMTSISKNTLEIQYRDAYAKHTLISYSHTLKGNKVIIKLYKILIHISIQDLHSIWKAA